jgi:HEAT repeat protein
VAALSAGEAALALGELYPLLDDPDWRVRREVALALARMPDPAPANEPLVDAVEKGDVARRNAAIEALRHIGPVAAQPVLARLARAEGSARRFLIEVLADAGTEACVPVLSALLDDGDPNIPPAAAESLGRIAGEAAHEALLHALGHEDPVVRLAALQAFTARGESLPWERLEPLMDDLLCRRAALGAAAACADERALRAIVGAFSDAKTSMSGEAALACAAAARSGRREQVRAALLARTGMAAILRQLAEHAVSPDVRRAAVECLGLVADAESVVTVLSATQAAETSAAANEALDSFGSDAVPHALAIGATLGGQGMAALLRWALACAAPADHPALVALSWRALEAGPLTAAWDAIAAVGSPADAEELIRRLEIRAAVVEPGEYTRALAMLLRRHPTLAPRLAEVAPLDTRLGLAIVELIARAGLPVPLEPLRHALTAPDPGVRAAAVRALAASGHESARDALEFALADEEPGVQAAAAEALGALGAARGLLEQSLHAAEPRVRQAAARAIARRGEGVRAALLPALDDPEPAVVLAALEGLGDEATVEDLTGLTTHPDPDVAAEALLRLRERAPERAAEAAVGMVDHPAWAVRLEAVRALEAARAATQALLRERYAVERDELVREAIEQQLAPQGPAGGGSAV